MAARLSTAAILAAALITPQVYQNTPQLFCKPVPGSLDWPSVSDWQALNKSVAGRLLTPVPPGLVCQTNSSSHNIDACVGVLSQWTNSSWHAQDPFTADYNDESCLPDARAPCSAEGYPAYVVNATNVSHVQVAVKFAKRTGVRLIVKGTGHDFLGRSSGRDSFSIYTHNIRGVDVSMDNACAKKHGGVAAVKIAAGMRMGEIYTEISKYNITIVGGADPNVGIGGWSTGGGHSPISSKYGLGADQVLEMEVVTADGTHLTINERSYPDLFWAMRGGGGSTFAVLISVTVRAYPRLGVALYYFSYNTTANTDTFWSLLAYFHTAWANSPPEGVGLELRLGSRLLDREDLETDLQTLKQRLKQTTSGPHNTIIGHLVAGSGLKNVDIPGGGNSVLPAWRHASAPDVALLNNTAKLAVTDLLRDVEVEALRQLAPNTGAYINEADPAEPNW
ncbi:hypothetical protein A1O1_09252 [Capronia coronata CBS 617.96]|uniref:FAD-binding PCMH-type domain-containing protein n=1 Tax=Capronia coronata CBS 617.96 TaxID=1182541 RepID=W9XNH4_9EURO|nr:uncharacterized protein A1O1_09252 [Capronia coronata CBS 617.96]EXJ78850.1 hypothetical protein A1O1_09252 [Capronia coronata CBS 617.96]